MVQSQFSWGMFWWRWWGGSRWSSYWQWSQAVLPDPWKAGGSLSVPPLDPNQMMTPLSDNQMMTPLSDNQISTQQTQSTQPQQVQTQQIQAQPPQAQAPQPTPTSTAPVMSDDVFSMFMQWQLSGSPEQMQKARKRKLQLDMLTTNDPSTVWAMIASGKESMSSQKMIDLKNYAPEFYAEVQRAVKWFTETESINSMWNEIYKNLNKWYDGRDTDVIIEDTAESDDVDVAMADDPMTKINDDTLAFIQENFWETAADYYELSSRLLTNNPAIQSALEEYTTASAERKNLQRQIENVWDEARKVLGSDVPESFVSAYIARQTRDLTKKLNAAIDVENTTFQNAQTLRNNAIQQLEMIEKWQAQDILRQQNAFENQMALAKMQMSATSNWQWNDELNQYYRTNNGQLETSSTLPSWPQWSSWAASFWENMLQNITRSDPNAPDMDIAMTRWSAIYSPFDWTITKAETQSNGNVQIQMKTSDWTILTFNHLDPSSLEWMQVWSTISAWQVLWKAGNTGMVKSFINGQWVTLRDENGNIPQMTLANGKTPEQMLAEWAWSHVDIRAIWPNWERLTNAQIQEMFTKNAQPTWQEDLAPYYNKLLSWKTLSWPDQKFIEWYGISQKEFAQQANAYQKHLDMQMSEHAKTLLDLVERLKGMSRGEFQLVRWNVWWTVGRDYRNTHNRLLSSTALQELINLKADWATFGALSNQELEFITNASTELRVRSTYNRYMEILDEMEKSLKKGIENSWSSFGWDWRSWSN